MSFAVIGWICLGAFFAFIFGNMLKEQGESNGYQRGFEAGRDSYRREITRQSRK